MDMNFYQKQFQLFSQTSMDQMELKSIDANTLLEVFELINDVIAVLITKPTKYYIINDFL